jgi:hypothetical protein
MRARSWIRAGLVLLALIDGGQGLWAYLAPRSFYYHVPTVSMYPPFNQHFVSDFGGLQLAMTVVMVAAAVILERRLVIVALLAFLVYAVTHLIFHLTHLMGMTGGAMLTNIAGLGVVAAIPAVLLVVTYKSGPGGTSAGPTNPAHTGQAAPNLGPPERGNP